jgi:hypothetical protein
MPPFGGFTAEFHKLTINIVVFRVSSYLMFLFAAIDLAAADGPERWVETVLPSLFYSPACWSSVELQNLGGRPVIVEIKAHGVNGALVPLVGQSEMTVRLSPGDRPSYRLQIEGETTGAWVKVRERVPLPSLSQVVAVGGKTECTVGNELRTAAREAAYPTRNPWFSEDVSEANRAEVISLINTSENAAVAWACYSSGSFFSVPKEKRPPEFVPLCSSAFDVQIPPFGSRQFPLDKGGNTHFTLKTRGEAIVLQMLRPSDATVNLFAVDSTITFGSEAPASHNR